MKKQILITGISGFIAKHVAREFLDADYRVRGTLRSIEKAEEVAMALNRKPDDASLEFVEADLNSDSGWDRAAEGCDGVAHIASPFPLSNPKNEEELIRPAVDGTLRLLEAAKRAGIKRFVQTSSLVAVIYGHSKQKTEFNESDWTNISSVHTTAYAKSKTLAEQAARNFASTEREFHFCTINPGTVWGPAMDRDVGSSLSIVQMLLNGKYPGCPKLSLPVVDVRDVAKMHLLAMETNDQSGGRYFAVADTPWLVDSARALKKGLGKRARKVPNHELPNFVVKLVAIADPVVRAIVPDLGWKPEIENSATRQALGVDFMSSEEAVTAAAKSLIEKGLVSV